MADPQGFLRTRERELPRRRPVPVRIRDWKEVYEEQPVTELQRQAGRCMDCGIPFCHSGCPLGNLIPEWNDLAWKGEWRQAIDRLHATNNFPEFTGRLCPAPCESACVLGINQPAVTIKQVEVSIIDRAFANGTVTPEAPERLSGKTVAVVGSGPAGLAAAQQLTRAGHTVAVYERADRAGRPAALRHPRVQDGEGRPRPADRADEVRGHPLPHRGRGRRTSPGPTCASGSTPWSSRSAPPCRATCRCPGASSTASCRPWTSCRRPTGSPSARASPARSPRHGKDVIVIGGGDTGADCIGTAHRQGARSVTSLEIMPQPPAERAAHQPWPTYPMTFRVASAHEEGGDRVYAVSTSEIVGDARAGWPRCGCTRSSWARAASRRSRAATRRSPRSSCCSRWASSARSRSCSTSSVSNVTPAPTPPATTPT